MFIIRYLTLYTTQNQVSKTQIKPKKMAKEALSGQGGKVTVYVRCISEAWDLGKNVSGTNTNALSAVF